MIRSIVRRYMLWGCALLISSRAVEAEVWQPLTQGIGLLDLTINPTNPFTLYARTLEAGVLKSVDGGTGWVAINAGLPNLTIWSLAIDPQQPQILYVGPESGGIYQSVDEGVSWRQADPSLTGHTFVNIAVDPHNPEIMYASGPGIFKSVDGGRSWQKIGLWERMQSADVTLLVIDPVNPVILYVGLMQRTSAHVFSYGVVRSADGGNTWQEINEGLPVLVEPGAFPYPVPQTLRIDPHDPQTLYLVASGQLYISRNGGEIWASLPSIEAYSISTIVVDPHRPHTFYVGANLERSSISAEGGVFVSRDGGDRWVHLGDRLSASIRELVLDAHTRTLYASIWDRTTNIGSLFKLVLSEAESGVPMKTWGAIKEKYNN